MAAHLRKPLNLFTTSVSRKGSRGWGWYHKALADADIKKVPRPFPPAKAGHSRQRAYMDMAIGDEPAGRLVFELAVHYFAPLFLH
jgi:hypothetical protein